VPYFALVHAASRPRALWLFLAVPIVLALLEESLWDVFVWQEHLPFALDGLAGVATAVLAVPQVTHYLLDGMIWKRPDRGALA
jgi:hypothetical protein